MITTWLAAGYAGEGGSAEGRIALVAVAVLAVVAYTLLQLKARSQRARAGRRRYDPWDWRTYPPESRPGGHDGPGGHGGGAPDGNEESRRPDWRYGYPPGYEPYPLYDEARSPWAVRDDAASDRRSLAAAGPGTRARRARARRPFQPLSLLPRVCVLVTANVLIGSVWWCSRRTRAERRDASVGRPRRT